MNLAVQLLSFALFTASITYTPMRAADLIDINSDNESDNEHDNHEFDFLTFRQQQRSMRKSTKKMRKECAAASFKAEEKRTFLHEASPHRHRNYTATIKKQRNQARRKKEFENNPIADNDYESVMISKQPLPDIENEREIERCYNSIMDIYSINAIAITHGYDRLKLIDLLSLDLFKKWYPKLSDEQIDNIYSENHVKELNDFFNYAISKPAL